MIITLNLIIESIYWTSLLKDTKKINNKQKNTFKRNKRICKYIEFKYINSQGEDKFFSFELWFLAFRFKFLVEGDSSYES